MYQQVTDLKDWSQEKSKHTYRAVRVTAENERLPNFKRTKLIKSLEDPTDKGRCDFDKSNVVVTHSFGGIKLEFLEQIQ
jgi:hypothetical protein